MKFLEWFFRGEVSSQKEKRRSDRFDSYIPASITADEHSELVQIFNLSETGCAINSQSSFALKDKIYVQMQVIYTTKSGEIYVSQAPIEGKLVRNIESDQGKLFGIQFIDEINEQNAVKLVLDDIQKEHLKEFGGRKPPKK